MHKTGYIILHKMTWQSRQEVLICAINAFAGGTFQLQVNTYSFCECFCTQICACSIFLQIVHECLRDALHKRWARATKQHGVRARASHTTTSKLKRMWRVPLEGSRMLTRALIHALFISLIILNLSFFGFYLVYFCFGV